MTDKVYIDTPKNVLYESCVRNTTMESLEKYINSFDYTMDNQEGVLKLTRLLEYVFDKNSNINKNRILKSIASNVVPKVTNLKGLLESLTDICNKNEIWHLNNSKSKFKCILFIKCFKIHHHIIMNSKIYIMKEF